SGKAPARRPLHRQCVAHASLDSPFLGTLNVRGWPMRIYLCWGAQLSRSSLAAGSGLAKRTRARRRDHPCPPCRREGEWITDGDSTVTGPGSVTTSEAHRQAAKTEASPVRRAGTCRVRGGFCRDGGKGSRRG